MSRARNCFGSLAVGALLFFGAFAVLPAIAQTSTFDNDAEGWKVANLLISPFFTNPPTVVDLFDPNWSDTGGNPGGNVAWTDTDGNIFTFSAPDSFLGDHHGAYGGSLSLDMKVDAADNGAFIAAILVGGGHTMYYDLNPPGSDWTSVSIPLSETGWYDSDGNDVTQQGITETLGALDAIYINGDWLSGTETANLDNVNLVPEPSAAMLIGAAALLFSRRRSI